MSTNYDFDTVIDRSSTSSLKWSNPMSRCGVEEALPMWVADMDFASPPELLAALKTRVEHPIFGYTLRPDGFYQALEEWTKRRYGWKIQREWICNAPGVVPAINLAILAYTSPGDKVLIQSPVYYPFSSSVLNNGRQLVENRLLIRDERYFLDLADLERRIDSRTKLLILSSPHNPVGRVWSREELDSLVEICSRKGVIIISDEIHADLIMPGSKHTSLASISAEAERISVTCLAVSKTFNLAGLCTANVIIPDAKLRKAFLAMTDTIGLGMSNAFGIVAQEAAYTTGEAWLEALLPYIAANYSWLKDRLAREAAYLKVFPMEGTYLAWVDFSRAGMNDAELKAFLLKKARLWFDDGPMFGSGGEGFQRINLACPRVTLDLALDRLLGALAARQGRS
jgi:cystathionine beta-lyase